MVDTAAINDYIKKLNKIVNFEYTLSLGSYRLVKKQRIDDIMCCIYATLPSSYKQMLKSKKDIQHYKSVLCYSMLAKELAKTFFLDKNMVILRISEVNKLLQGIQKNIERDLHDIGELLDE